MHPRLHRGGHFRSWLGRHLGGDASLGDRVWRRTLHILGALILLYYVLPTRFFIVLTTEQVILIGLGVMLALEVGRHFVALELPTIRPWEEARVASFAFFAVGLVAAVLLFPEAVAVVVVLGTATLDPLIGELRRSSRLRPLYPALPFLLYLVLAIVAWVRLTSWSTTEILFLALVASMLAIAIERPKYPWLDDDLAMTLVPGFALLLLVHFW